MNGNECQHCPKDLVEHHHRNLKCPDRPTTFLSQSRAAQNARSGDAPRCGEAEVLKSFDAQVWAREFIKIVHENPTVATNEETMIGWFANALMRGYDEHYWRSEKYKRQMRRILTPWWKRLFVPLTKFGS